MRGKTLRRAKTPEQTKQKRLWAVFEPFVAMKSAPTGRVRGELFLKRHQEILTFLYFHDILNNNPLFCERSDTDEMYVDAQKY